MSSQNSVYIVSAVRTPIGALNGSLSSLKAHELGKVVMEEALKRVEIDGADVSEVIVGQVFTANQGQNPARQASLAAGIPLSVPAWTLNMLCGSGLKCVTLGAQSILNQDADIVLAVGQESMSQTPHAILLRGSAGNKFGDSALVDTLLQDGLLDAFGEGHMGVTCENVSKDYGVSRDDQDRLAVESQRRYAEAKAAGYFDNEIVPVVVIKKKETVEVTDDENPRPNTTLEILSKLRPAFVKDGTVTAGNASSISDGAAAVVVVSKAELEKRKLKPLARIVSWAEAGIQPRIMGMGPVRAVRKAVAKAGWTLEDVDLFELNEAFAAQSVAVARELGLSDDKVNIQGGAVTMGHPLADSGTRILVTLLHAMQRTKAKRGVASLCIGGGMGIAMCVETV